MFKKRLKKNVSFCILQVQIFVLHNAPPTLSNFTAAFASLSFLFFSFLKACDFFFNLTDFSTFFKFFLEILFSWNSRIAAHPHQQLSNQSRTVTQLSVIAEISCFLYNFLLFAQIRYIIILIWMIGCSNKSYISPLLCKFVPLLVVPCNSPLFACSSGLPHFSICSFHAQFRLPHRAVHPARRFLANSHLLSLLHEVNIVLP